MSEMPFDTSTPTDAQIEHAAYGRTDGDQDEAIVRILNALAKDFPEWAKDGPAAEDRIGIQVFGWDRHADPEERSQR